MGSAIAFRLFLFFVPLLLLVVGIAGFASDFVNASDVSRTTGIYGSLGAEISEAFHQPGFTRWFAVLFGLFGVLTAGRSLSRVLRAASAAAWRLPLSGSRASFRAAGVVAGLICGMALIAILVNRVREDLGLGVAGLAFVPALVIYGLAWLGVSMMLPRVTDDPGALLPGSLLVALTLAVMQAISEFYLPDKLSRASQLYGAIGATIVTLGWFFILGRGIALAMELNAAIYERYGSISQVVFSLPFSGSWPVSRNTCADSSDSSKPRGRSGCGRGRRKEQSEAGARQMMIRRPRTLRRSFRRARAACA